jgi:glycosyltransferase involved in cell wall biosynthesis
MSGIAVSKDSPFPIRAMNVSENRSVCFLTGSHLCHNPRVMKAACALARRGFSVEVLGAWSDPALKARDEELLPELPYKFTPVADMTANTVSRMRHRLRKKSGHVAQQFTSMENRWQLGYFYPDLRRAAFQRKADLYIAHSEQAMAAAVDLLRYGRRAGVDMEDWFSEDLLPDARRHRPLRLLHSLESKLLVTGIYASCPSRVMSAALVEAHRCPPPTVVYNAFEWSERLRLDGNRKDRSDSGRPSIHWYSQTLGRGRGLEDLLAALPLLKTDAEVHLRGQPTGDFDRWLQSQLSDRWRPRIFLHGLVSNRELLSRIAEHDIGFAGEVDDCRSRNLTVTNKILHYLLAGLAVVASDTAGQREAAEQAPDAVLLYPCGDPAALAARLDALLVSPELLNRTKASALRAAERTFCWERQEKVFLDCARRALSEPEPNQTWLKSVTAVQPTSA